MRGDRYRFDQLSVIHEDALIFDFRRGDPALDLISKPLQLLDLLFEICLIFFFLVAVGGIVDLLPDVLERLHTFCHLFKTAINFSCNNKVNREGNRSAKFRL